VKVNVTDFNGKIAPASSSIVISPLTLTTDFSPLSACIGTTITFMGSASGGTTPYSFTWNFGDGTAKVSGNPAFHSYSVKGTYTVTMNVTDFNAATSSITHTLTASGCALVVTPTVPATGTVGTPVSVSATASGGTSPYFFSWNFGDGTANIAGNTASHTYSVKGTYTVRVNVTDISARIASASSSITVSPLTLTADFTFSPTAITPGSPVTFTGRSFGGTSPYIFSWNFGDGTGRSGNPVQHTYSTSGPFSVRLNVTDANGVKVSIVHIIQPPTLFVNCPTTGTVGSTVTCTASASGGIPPITFTWTGTGGTPSSGTGSSFSTTYNVKGSYTISVSATDSATPTPNTATASNSITITPLPLAVGFIFSPTSPTAGSPVTFTATSTGGTAPYLFAWRFDDGSIATGNPVTHTYLSTGPFVVTVNVTDANSILATSSHSLSLRPPPPLQADFGPIKTLIGTTTFVSLITGGLPPYTCVWTFGDGTPITTGCKPDHTYIASGVFTAQVTITDNIGQTTSATHPVTVENNPTFFGSRLHWDRKLALGSTETFSAKMSNPSDLNVTATVTIDIFTDDGVFIAHLTASESLAPGAADTNFPLSFVPTGQGEFLFSATLTYSASLQVTSSTTTPVTGMGGTRTGIFTVF
jgi:PKD repeat protein